MPKLTRLGQAVITHFRALAQAPVDAACDYLDALQAEMPPIGPPPPPAAS